nr:hypothetical protein [Tanacetum cinerariifolium]
MAKAFKLNYSTLTNNNRRISSNHRNRQIAQPGMNMGQDRKMQMVGGNGENQFRHYVRQNVRNLNGYNAVHNVENQVRQNLVQNPGIQTVGNQNGLIVVSRIANHNANQNRNGYVVAAWAKAAARDINKIKKVNANCILMVNLQQASTLGAQTDKCHVYDSDKSVELAIRNDKYEVIYATCKQCLITTNHDECVLTYVNGMNSSKKNKSTNASESVNQTKHKAHVKKSKKLGSEERLASPRPSKPRTCLRNLQAKGFQILLLLTGLRDSRGRIRVSTRLLFSNLSRVVLPTGESAAAPEICCRRRKRHCDAQKAAATAAEHLVLLEYVYPSCDHILDTFFAHPPS